MSANTLAQDNRDVQQLCGQVCHQGLLIQERCMASPWMRGSRYWMLSCTGVIQMHAAGQTKAYADKIAR